ncbi:MAG: dipeptide/oligopeptide/nickel ABC transporter ATP-binding protein [Anaerolineaceae bacterium]|nr:dipeptide/oligopeptide/nickel ABC transporter ATP-binding protein [Anaerolineaceae bacterium]
MSDNNVLLEIKDLRTYFYLDDGVLKAVDGVSFDIRRNSVLGIVGESGCGKSITARSILRIVPPPGKVEGEILFHDNGKTVDLAKLPRHGDDIRAIRGRDIAMIFQEPMSAFSPVHTIGNQIMEAVLVHEQVEKAEARGRAVELLRQVGISMPESRVDNYPHEMSGGMLQRAMIAMALALRPKILIADEPTTALDVTIQAQILRLMKNLKEDIGMSIIFITHDLGVIANMADDVAVMYLGRVVEYGTVRQIFRNPKHPYTQALLKSIPMIGKERGGKLASIEGTVPVPINPPRQCGFADRCAEFIAGRCDADVPPLLEVEPGHLVRCVLYENETEAV